MTSPKAPNRRASALTTLALLTGLSSLVSCQATARSTQITPGPVKIEKMHASCVQILVESPRAGIFAGPRIPVDNLQEAIEAAIRESALFEVWSDQESFDFELRVQVEEVEEEDYSLDMTSKVTMIWSLVEPGQDEPTWVSQVNSSHKSTPFDSKDMKARKLFALEGATRKNIDKALRRLSKASLAGEEPEPHP
ncbi:MAG: hypothetical protein ACI841_005417 [Planctomycetota bacterium]|jgi:hypothetical protein